MIVKPVRSLGRERAGFFYVPASGQLLIIQVKLSR